MPYYISLPIIAVLIVLSTMFSMSDMALSSVNILRIKKDAENNKRSAKIAYKLITNYEDTISTILFCNNLTNIGISSIMVFVVQNLAGTNETIENVISILISTFILLLCGEVIPKQIAKIYNYRLSLFFSYFVVTCKYIFYPFTFIFTKIAYFFSKLFLKGTKKVEENIQTEVGDELQEMVQTIEDEGIINEDKADLIRSAIEFNSTEAYEIMTPRVDVLMFDINDDIENLINDSEYFRYSRIPIYEEDKDNIVGILPIKLLQRKILTNSDINLKELIYKPTFVPRSIKITDILSLFKKNGHHMVVVLDEYGGVEGIVTIEDIIEELVGPIFDETDKIEKEYSETKDGYIVSGSMNIDDFFELVEIEPEFDDPSFNTVSGWVIDNLERFAKENDEFDFENLHIKVLSVDEYTVERIQVTINKKQDEEDNKSED